MGRQGLVFRSTERSEGEMEMEVREGGIKLINNCAARRGMHWESLTPYAFPTYEMGCRYKYEGSPGKAVEHSHFTNAVFYLYMTWFNIILLSSIANKDLIIYNITLLT